MVKQGYKPTEIGVIPEDWEVGTFEDFLTGFSSGMTPYRGVKEYYNGNFPWITSGELNYNIITDTIEKITPEAIKRTNLKIIPKGTFLIAITGLEAEGTRGSCAITGIDATTNQSCMALYPIKGKITTEYLYHYYVKYGNELALKYCQGTKQQSYNAVTAKKLPIILPSLAEQEAIASALSDADAWIDSLEQLIAKKRLIKQGAMQTLLTPKEDWEVKKLGEVCDYKNGKSLENKISDTGVFNIISLNSIDTRGKLKKEHHKTNFNDNSLKKGDIVMVLSDVAHGNFLGLCDIIPDDNYVLNQRMGGLFNFRNIHVPFVRLLINYNQKYFKFSGKGSSQLNLGKPDILNFDLQFPSLSEQERIATILSDMDAELEALETQLGKARQIKQGMMQELLTGRTRLV